MHILKIMYYFFITKLNGNFALKFAYLSLFSGEDVYVNLTIIMFILYN